MLIGQLRDLLNKLPAEYDNMAALVATNVRGERKIDMICHFGVLPIPGNPSAVLLAKSEYDRMVTEGQAPAYPEYQVPGKDDVLPGDEWKTQG